MSQETGGIPAEASDRRPLINCLLELGLEGLPLEAGGVLAEGFYRGPSDPTDLESFTTGDWWSLQNSIRCRKHGNKEDGSKTRKERKGRKEKTIREYEEK